MTTETKVEAVAWRCFYCDEVFTDRESARLHFGAGNFLDQKTPGCQIDIAAYRAMEETVRRYQEEDADIHRSMHRMAGEHALALRREEEKGYARGLKDSGQCPCDSAAQHQSALDALRGEVTENEGVIRVWRRRCEEAERRVAEIHGALRIALASIDETCKEMTIGDRFTNAGQSLIDALPVCRAALTKESP